jgi:hypothetical protein
MVVSGVPEACEQHALKLACFAIEMRQALLRYNEHSDLKQPLVSPPPAHTALLLCLVLHPTLSPSLASPAAPAVVAGDTRFG